MSSKLASREREMALGRDNAEIARILGVPEEVVGRIPEASSNRLAEFLLFLERTLPGDSVRGYLHHPNPNMHGEKPISLLLRGEFDRIEADLLALQEGVYL
jgi:hypothetical protein